MTGMAKPWCHVAVSSAVSSACLFVCLSSSLIFHLVLADSRSKVVLSPVLQGGSMKAQKHEQGHSCHTRVEVVAIETTNHAVWMLSNNK